MRTPLLLAAGIILATTAIPASTGPLAHPAGATEANQITDISSAKRKTKKKRQSGYQAYGRSQTQIACTFGGCFPAPRGCRVQPGRIPFTWEPSGYDEIICPGSPYPRYR
jgi:hypothetical protein